MGCAGCVRVLLIAINAIFFLIGGAALGIGIWVVTDSSDLFKYLTKLSSVVTAYNIPDLIKGAAYVFLVAGGVIFGIAFVGCCGAWKRIKCLLIIYAVIIGVIILAEVAVIVVAYFFSSSVDTYLQGYMLKALNSYNSSLTPLGTNGFTYSYSNDLTLAIDILQLQFNCCGVINGSDYASSSTNWTRTVAGSPVSMIIPASCCQMSGSSDFITLIKSAASGNLTLTNNTCPFYGYASNMNTGCYSAITNVVKTNSTLVLGIAAGILAIQLLLIIFACCVCKSVDADSKVTV